MEHEAQGILDVGEGGGTTIYPAKSYISGSSLGKWGKGWGL